MDVELRDVAIDQCSSGPGWFSDTHRCDLNSTQVPSPAPPAHQPHPDLFRREQRALALGKLARGAFAVPVQPAAHNNGYTGNEANACTSA